MKIMICEKPFLSVQGEGNFVGVPCVFVRFSGCNLACPGCDTKYHTEGFETTTEEVIEMIKELNPLTKGVVFTGGEPLLRQEAIVEIVKGLNPKFNPVKGVSYDSWWFQIETNGIIEPELINEQLGKVFIQFNISPKLKRFNELAGQLGLCTNWYLRPFQFIVKPVVTDEEDMIEVKDIVSRLNVSPDRVYLMAEGANREGQEEKMERVINLAIKYGYNFTPRLHVLVWNITRGV